MKKVISVFILALGLLVAGNEVKAQNKIGYMSVDQMVGLMPETGKLDSVLQKYRVDSLNSTFASIVQEYGYKDSMLTKTDTSKTPKSVLTQLRQDVNILAYQIQNWDALTQQAIQAKQEELYGPIYTKVITALNQVAKEKGYGFVFSKESLLVAPPGDDMLPMVATKLGVKLPASLTQPKTGAK
jgi:outer membrane protein